jgi:hypothetical protein
MTRKSVWANADGLRVGFGPNVADYSSQGVQKQIGNEVVVRFTLDGEKFSSGTYVFETQETVPVGAVPLYAHVRITEAFVLGGTTPTIQIGDAGSATRYGSLAQASAQALGTYTNTVTATPLTAAGTIAVSLGGTTPTVTTAGKAVVTLAYRVNSGV